MLTVIRALAGFFLPTPSAAEGKIKECRAIEHITKTYLCTLFVSRLNESVKVILVTSVMVKRALVPSRTVSKLSKSPYQVVDLKSKQLYCLCKWEGMHRDHLEH